MSDLDLLIHGTFACGERGSIGIAGGSIVEIGTSVSNSSKQEIDFGDSVILPSWIDAHVHFNEPGRTEWEGIETGSRALAAGGGTVFVDMPLNSTPPVITREAFEEKRRIAKAKSCVDFALWGGLTPESLEHMPAMADAGAIGFKAFMCPSGLDEFPAALPSTLKRGMQIAASVGLPVAVHAEDPDVVTRHQAQHPPKARDMRAWLDSRPIEAELSAIRIAIDLAGETGCALHIVHVTCPEGIALVTAAKQRGVNVTVETCPHYLLLDDQTAIATGPAAKCAPPIRNAATVANLWRELEAGRIDTIGSDHSPSSPDLKQGDDLFAMWGGIAGIQHGLPLLLDRWERERRSSDRRANEDPNAAVPSWLSTISSNVAKRFRLPNKGGLVAGHDADFVVISRQPHTIRREELLTRHAISPYVGTNSELTVTATYLRGQNVSTGTRGKFLAPAARL